MLELDLSRTLSAFELRVSLDVRNEMLALFGPSGSGKSMLLKMIAGIERPTTGRITCAKRPLFDTDAKIDLPARDRRIGYVPQQYALFPHLSAVENVQFPMRRGFRRASAQQRTRALELLDTVGLADRADALPRHLSGGQQQRVALARALAVQPEILLFDEPFAALDAPVRMELREELRSIQRDFGIPAVFVTHALDDAAVVADRVAVIVAGEIRQVANVRDIVEKPADLDVAQLVLARNVLPATITRSDGQTVIQSALGPISTSRSDLTGDGPWWLVVRPEAILFGDRPASSPRSTNWVQFTGRVTSVAGDGLNEIVHVDVAGSDLLVRAAPYRGEVPGVGMEVRLTIPATAIHVLRDHPRTQPAAR